MKHKNYAGNVAIDMYLLTLKANQAWLEAFEDTTKKKPKRPKYADLFGFFYAGYVVYRAMTGLRARR